MPYVMRKAIVNPECCMAIQDIPWVKCIDAPEARASSNQMRAGP